MHASKSFEFPLPKSEHIYLRNNQNCGLSKFTIVVKFFCCCVLVFVLKTMNWKRSCTNVFRFYSQFVSYLHLCCKVIIFRDILSLKPWVRWQKVSFLKLQPGASRTQFKLLITAFAENVFAAEMFGTDFNEISVSTTWNAAFSYLVIGHIAFSCF